MTSSLMPSPSAFCVTTDSVNSEPSSLLSYSGPYFNGGPCFSADHSSKQTG